MLNPADYTGCAERQVRDYLAGEGGEMLAKLASSGGCGGGDSVVSRAVENVTQ